MCRSILTSPTDVARYPPELDRLEGQDSHDNDNPFMR